MLGSSQGLAQGHLRHRKLLPKLASLRLHLVNLQQGQGFKLGSSVVPVLRSDMKIGQGMLTHAQGLRRRCEKDKFSGHQQKGLNSLPWQQDPGSIFTILLYTTS